MKKLIFIFMLSITSHLFSASTTSTDTTLDGSITKILPQERAADYIQAYLFLVKAKPSDVIYFILSNNTYIYDIEKITPLNNGTLLMFQTLKSAGYIFQIIRIEDIVELSYTSDRSTLPGYEF
jgi:hypothetical protein